MEDKDIMKEEATREEEKDTTVELRTAFEEETANEPPKKKKFSKKKIVLMCVAGFILLIGIAVGIFFLIGKLNAPNITVVKGEFHNAQPDAAVTFSAAELASINTVMAGGADDATVKQTIAMMYAKANYNKIHNVDQAITILQGQGWADAFGAVGSMAVRGFKVQSGNEFYYQKAAPIVECDPEELFYLLSGGLQQQERVYSNGVDDFRMTGTLKGSDADIPRVDDEKNPMLKTLPFVTVNVPKKRFIKNKKDYATFKDAGYYLEDPREITNFNITANTIVLNPLEDDEARIEMVQTEAGDKYYVCRFSLLITGDNRDECVHYAREYLRASAKSDDLEYLQFDVTLEVWENGYFKMMHDEEQWKGTASGAETTSRSWYESITYYDFDAEVFNETDAAEYQGEDWATKIIAHYKAELDNAK